MPSPASVSRTAALLRARALARGQGHVLGRRQIYALGVERWQVKAQLKAQRWQRLGRQTVALHNGALSDEGDRWRAVLEVGPRAALDGVTALLEAGLEGFNEAVLHVIVPKSSTPRRAKGVCVHESRRFDEDDIATTGIRRVRAPVAAIHGALWARSDRQAVLLVTMTIQQKLASADEVSDALTRVKRHRRRRTLVAVIDDIRGGSHSLGELDVLAGLRRRGLPEPTRQSMRRLPSGKAYLDIEWEEWALVLELDGAQHDAAAHRLADALRDFEVIAGGRSLLRIPMVAWRLDEEAILDRLTEIFVSRGWAKAA